MVYNEGAMKYEVTYSKQQNAPTGELRFRISLQPAGVFYFERASYEALSVFYVRKRLLKD
jgi:hypothetical protein